VRSGVKRSSETSTSVAWKAPSLPGSKYTLRSNASVPGAMGMSWLASAGQAVPGFQA